MTEKEQVELMAKVVNVQECTENIDMYNEFIEQIGSELEKLNAMEPFWIKVYGSIEGEGATEAVMPLNMHEEVIGFIKEKFKKEIQSRKNSISKEYEKLTELLQ